MTERVHIAQVDPNISEKGIQVLSENPALEYLGSHPGLVWLNSTDSKFYYEQGGSANAVEAEVDLSNYAQIGHSHAELYTEQGMDLTLVEEGGTGSQTFSASLVKIGGVVVLDFPSMILNLQGGVSPYLGTDRWAISEVYCPPDNKYFVVRGAINSTELAIYARVYSDGRIYFFNDMEGLANWPAGVGGVFASSLTWKV